MGKGKQKQINTLGLLFGIIVFMAILTYLIPAEEFERVEGINGLSNIMT